MGRAVVAVQKFLPTAVQSNPLCTISSNNSSNTNIGEPDTAGQYMHSNRRESMGSCSSQRCLFVVQTNCRCRQPTTPAHSCTSMRCWLNPKIVLASPRAAKKLIITSTLVQKSGLATTSKPKRKLTDHLCSAKLSGGQSRSKAWNKNHRNQWGSYRDLIKRRANRRIVS